MRSCCATLVAHAVAHYRGLGFTGDRPESRWDPASDDTSRAPCGIDRVWVRLPKGDEVCAACGNLAQKLRAHREPGAAHARSSHDPHSVASLDKPRHYRHKQRDVSATLKHRAKNAGRLRHGGLSIPNFVDELFHPFRSSSEVHVRRTPAKEGRHAQT
jgi:hypothetical protein